jgi:hypothetical protein
LEHLPCDGDLGHLEDGIAAVAHHLRADLDQLVLQTRQRPALDRLRRRQRAQEIAEVVGERMKLEPHRIGGERSARQSRPLDRAFAFLDPLLARPALIVESNDALGLAAHVRRIKFSGMSRIYLRADAAFAMPEVYEFLEVGRIKYAIRLPANQVLQSLSDEIIARRIIELAKAGERKPTAPAGHGTGSRARIRRHPAVKREAEEDWTDAKKGGQEAPLQLHPVTLLAG